MNNHKSLIEEAERRWLAGTDKTRAEVMVEVLREALTEVEARVARAESIIAEQRASLTAARQKLESYYLANGGVYVGGVEYSRLVAQINAALALKLDEEQKP